MVQVAEGGTELGQKLMGRRSGMKTGSGVDVAETDGWGGAWAQLGSLVPVLVGCVTCPEGAAVLKRPASSQIIVLPILPTPSLACNTYEQPVFI